MLAKCFIVLLTILLTLCPAPACLAAQSIHAAVRSFVEPTALIGSPISAPLLPSSSQINPFNIAGTTSPQSQLTPRLLERFEQVSLWQILNVPLQRIRQLLWMLTRQLHVLYISDLTLAGTEPPINGSMDDTSLC